jgi:hypothetical protein
MFIENQLLARGLAKYLLIFLEDGIGSAYLRSP